MSACALMGGSVGGASDGRLMGWLLFAVRLCSAATAGLGVVCLAVWSRYRRSSAMAAAPVSGAGESRGERPRGDLVRWVPKVAPPWALRAVEPGVVGLFGGAKGPVCVGVMARVDAAMVRAVARQALAVSICPNDVFFVFKCCYVFRSGVLIRKCFCSSQSVTARARGSCQMLATSTPDRLSDSKAPASRRCSWMPRKRARLRRRVQPRRSTV